MGTQLPEQDALSRAALAISSAEGAGVFERLSSELADILRVDVGFIAVFADEARAEMRMLAFCLDGRMRAPSGRHWNWWPTTLAQGLPGSA